MEEEGHRDDITGNTRKRARNDSEEVKSRDSDSPESKLVRVDSLHSVAKSDLDESGDGPVSSPEVKRIQYDLLDMLDDSDVPAIQGLDSVIKSFEDEISVPTCTPEAVPAVSSDSGGVSLPDLGYLLEASDDELGLPPATRSGEEKLTIPDVVPDISGSDGFSEKIEFGTVLFGYDSFDIGFESVSDVNSYDDAGGFVALDGLFDHSGEIGGSGFQWQPSETVSGL